MYIRSLISKLTHHCSKFRFQCKSTKLNMDGEEGIWITITRIEIGLGAPICNHLELMSKL